MILQLNICGLCASVEINTVTNLFSHLPFIFVYKQISILATTLFFYFIIITG